jgi:UPF0755 protein
MNPEDPNILVNEDHKDTKRTKIVGLVVTGVVATWLIGVVAWYQYNLRPVSASTHGQLVIVEPGNSVDTIADNLAQNKLIRSATAFKLYVTIHGLRGRLQSGAFDLLPSQSAREIAKIITSGKTASQKLVIPEGFTISAIKARAATFGIKPEAFDAALQQDLTGTKAAQRPAGVSLEGYLYPDTYTVTPTTTAQQLVRAMVNNFDKKVTDDIVAGFAAQGLTLHQGVTLASMVEREVSIPADRKLVAGVFLNRLKIGQRLESDVTVDYGRALLGKPFNTGLDSPYNTYRIAALPIGPICNPSLESMRAVVSPTPSEYFYFLAGKDGTTHYAKTIDQHNANVQKYLR